MASPLFHINQKVFAKIRGYPPWPGKIQNFHLVSNKLWYSVYLYGLDIHGEFVHNKLIDFSEYVLNNTSSLSARKLFVKALYDVQKDILDQSKKNLLVQSIPKTTTKHDQYDRYIKKTKLPQSNDKLGLLQFLNNDCGIKHKLLTLEKYLLGQKTNARSKWQTSFRLTEAKLLLCDYEIKSSLTLSNANYKNCLVAMNNIQKLKLSKRVLKKHPQLLDTVFKLKKYVGNGERKHKKIIVSDSERIRAKANQIYELFKRVLTT